MAEVAPAGAESLRRRNAAAVLRTLRHDGPASRAEVAARTGLAKATVGVIVAGLEEAGAVAEVEQSRSGERGRPGRRMTLAGGRPVAVGMEANVDYVAAVVLDLAGEVRHRVTRPIADVALVPRAVGEIAAEVAGWSRAAGVRPVGATVAIPGLVAGDERTVVWTPNLGITGTGVPDAVDAALGWAGRARVSNDADCGALAEVHHGAGRGGSHVLYLTGTVGIGAGLVDDGRLVRGGRGFAGEVGHLPLGDSDASCGCGRTGCWEASVGLHALLDAVGMKERPTPRETAEAVAAAASDSADVRAGVARIGRCLGRGLAVVSGVLDPAVIVLGGYFAPLGELVLAPARAELAASLATAAHGQPELRPGALGTESAALGAAERALADVFAGEIGLIA